VANCTYLIVDILTIVGNIHFIIAPTDDVSDPSSNRDSAYYDYVKVVVTERFTDRTFAEITTAF
jgi:hypothetical protein